MNSPTFNPTFDPTITHIDSQVLHVSSKTNWWFVRVRDSSGALAWGEGSLNGWEPALDALTESAALVQWPLFGFSTEVHPVTRAELAAGRFRSTGGTHIGCVARHLIASQVKRAVVITDGDVQAIPTALAERLRRARPRVRVGLLDGCNGHFCTSLGWPVTAIPALDR
jgi:hypothetical protein